YYHRRPYSFPCSRAFMSSLESWKMGVMSAYLGSETSKYFLPGIMRLVGTSISFGISVRLEFGASSPYRSLYFCIAIWPRRVRNQLIKTFAALGFGPPLIKLIEPPPVVNSNPSFQSTLS